jgi:hypothetical protein
MPDLSRNRRSTGERITKRLVAPLSLLFLVALAGCSSTPSTVASSGSPTATAVASSLSPTEAAVASTPPETASQAASEPTSPGDAPTAAPVAGGTATDFCGAFKELDSISEATSLNDLAKVGAQFQAAAADMRKYAPAEIEKAANTYADVIDTIGKAAAGGTFDEAALQKAMSEAMAGSAGDIASIAMWVAKNCDL